MNKLNENNYASFFLSPDEISKVFTASCDTVRNSCKCPHNRLCKDQFQDQNMYNIILIERQKFWKFNSKVVCMCPYFCMLHFILIFRFLKEKHVLLTPLNQW